MNSNEIKNILAYALMEDIGESDITTNTVINGNAKAKAVFLAKQGCVICGLGVTALVFKTYDKNIRFKALVKDGDSVRKGESIAVVSGKAKNILTAERVALNFLTFLSGISTKTRLFVNIVKPYKTKIIDTRKTIPGLRLLQKYAVRIGGGFNHRMNLEEMIMVKDNHLKLIGGIKKLHRLGSRYETEIEVTNLAEFRFALTLKPDIIMLDNMSVKDMKKAVAIRNKSSSKINLHLPKLEASGGITLKNIRSIAACGVDMISIGALTHSVDAADISLEFI